jgi:hypothetical protein
MDEFYLQHSRGNHRNMIRTLNPLGKSSGLVGHQFEAQWLAGGRPKALSLSLSLSP